MNIFTKTDIKSVLDSKVRNDSSKSWVSIHGNVKW